MTVKASKACFLVERLINSFFFGSADSQVNLVKLKLHIVFLRKKNYNKTGVLK